MNKIISIITIGLFLSVSVNAQNTSSEKVTTTIKSTKHLSSSILLWMRTDKPRQAGMDRWKGPHSKIISANTGLYEYRQLHFAEANTGLWQPINSVETTIPQDRKIDGVADVTLKNLLSVFKGKKQNKLASADEVNLFKRTILYASFPKNSSWYTIAQPNEKIETRSMVFFRKKEGVSDKDFKKFINEELTPALANTGKLKELRNKAYNPWKQKQWNTPNVAHDNDTDVQFQASLILGFSNENAMNDFFKSKELTQLSERLAIFCSAIHGYKIEQTITFVEDGKILETPQNN